MMINLIFSTISLLFVFLFIREYKKHSKSKKSTSKYKSKFINIDTKLRNIGTTNKELTKRNKELTTMFLSEKALFNCDLVYGRTKSKRGHSFKATYEVEILEMTSKKAKIKVLDFMTDDSKMSDPKYKKQLINYMDGDWVNLIKLDYILDDDAIKREIRIGQLLDN